MKRNILLNKYNLLEKFLTILLYGILIDCFRPGLPITLWMKANSQPYKSEASFKL